jgi:hypothetical protein
MSATPHIDRAIVEVKEMQEKGTALVAQGGNLNDFNTFHQVLKLNQSSSTNFFRQSINKHSILTL